MLEKCPYYEKCEGEIRHVRGNSEKFCLGTINWEFCTQFRNLELSGERIFNEVKYNNGARSLGNSRDIDDEIINLARNIDELLKITLENLLSYSNTLEDYVKMHPSSVQPLLEEEALQPIISHLKEKFEAINEVIMKIREGLKF